MYCNIGLGSPVTVLGISPGTSLRRHSRSPRLGIRRRSSPRSSRRSRWPSATARSERARRRLSQVRLRRRARSVRCGSRTTHRPPPFLPPHHPPKAEINCLSHIKLVAWGGNAASGGEEKSGRFVWSQLAGCLALRTEIGWLAPRFPYPRQKSAGWLPDPDFYRNTSYCTHTATYSCG